MTSFFAGLDVAVKTSSVCVLDADGRVMKQASVGSDPAAIGDCLGGFNDAELLVGLEAGPMSQHLHRGLADHGFDVVLMETRHVKAALQANPVKTDRNDALGIAQLLRMNWYHEVHCKSLEAQKIRAFLNGRRAMLSSLISTELSIRGTLRNFGLRLGAVSKGEFEAKVRELVGDDEMLLWAIEGNLDIRATGREKLAEMERRAMKLARADEGCRLVMTMPGIGHIVALTYVSAIDTAPRFAKSSDVGAWLGLTPRRYQSGETDITGGITKCGDTEVRKALHQAATVMLHRGRDNWLKAWALRVAQKRGMRRAKTALARRLAVVMHRMLQDGTPFEYTRDAAMAACAGNA